MTHKVDDELLVYDLERHKAFCLNRMATQVFRHCDGETTIADMAVRIGNALGTPVDEQVVRLGLVRLEKARLLDGPVPLNFDSSRRDMFRKMGRAAVAVLPLVTGIAVPTSAQALSPCVGTCVGREDGDICAPNCHCVGRPLQCVPKD